MNERIQELAEQATKKISFRLDPNTYKHIDDPEGDLERFEFDKHKFAELIVQECIGAISEVKERFFEFRLETDDFTEKNKFWAGEDACNQSVRKIETLFGVEE